MSFERSPFDRTNVPLEKRWLDDAMRAEYHDIKASMDAFQGGRFSADDIDEARSRADDIELLKKDPEAYRQVEASSAHLKKIFRIHEALQDYYDVKTVDERDKCGLDDAIYRVASERSDKVGRDMRARATAPLN